MTPGSHWRTIRGSWSDGRGCSSTTGESAGLETTIDFSLSDDQKLLVQLAERVAADLPTDVAKDAYPFEITKAFASAGLTGMCLPEEDGGQGASLLDAVLVIEAVARLRPRASDMLQATNFGAVRQIAAFGTREQKDRFLRPVLAGDGLVTVGMTEPQAGSAVTELRTRARIEDGKVVINGSKVFNSDGIYATHHVVWVRFGEGTSSIGSVIVTADAPGFSRTPARFASGEVYANLFFEDCVVPADQILIADNGFRRMMGQFNVERLGNAARCIGYADRAFTLAVEHAKRRTQFGRALAEFQGLQWTFAEMKLLLEGARLLLYRAAQKGPEMTAIDAALAKYACNEAAHRVCDSAVQIFGGSGLTSDSEVAYLAARARGWMVAGGTVEILRNRIAEEIFGRSFSQRPAGAPGRSSSS